uniref:Uncharacterized protein n=1 Tax=Anguilla anguilla TaxID=7936 RepID=A0A0E9XMV2_ANGAN
MIARYNIFHQVQAQKCHFDMKKYEHSNYLNADICLEKHYNFVTKHTHFSHSCYDYTTTSRLIYTSTISFSRGIP